MKANGLTAVLLAAALAAAAGEAPRAPGRVVFSDGNVLTGDIRTTEGKPLRMIEAETNRRLDLAVTEILKIRITVTNEEEYRVWRWVEDGSREKVYTGETYPKREFTTEITLRNGESFRGSVVAVLYVYEEGAEKPKKMVLKDKDQGEVGETLEDRVYIEAVEFTGAAPVKPAAETGIRLAVTPPEMLVTAHAVPRERDRSVEGVPAPIDGVVSFPGLLPGTYDLAVVTEKAIYLSLSIGAKDEAPLSGKQREEIASRAQEIRDFFETHEVLAGVATAEKVRAVVLLTRLGETSMGGQRTFRRFEVWAFHRGGDRWLVDGRFYLGRDQGEGLPAPPKVVLAPALGGHVVESGLTSIAFSIPEEDR